MILRCGVFYDGTATAPRLNVDLLIEGELVRGIRAATGLFDRETACITPGLVNAHVHLEMRGEPNTMASFLGTTPTERMLWAVENARKSLEAGVTTVRDVGCSGTIAMELRDAVNAGHIAGPRISAAGNVLCMTGGHGWFVGRAVDGPWDARKAVREQRHNGADCIKLIATGGVLTKGAVPGLAQLTEEEMHAAIVEAQAHGMRVCAHAIGTDGIKNALRAGVTSIEHGHMLDDEAIELFKQRNAYLVPTLTAPACILEHDDGSQPEFVMRKAREINTHLLGTIKRAYDGGVKIAGGSDAGTPYNFHENYAYEIELMHTMLGMSPQQALNAATATAAELIGITSGTLAPGEPADLLLLDRDITSDIRVLKSPRGVLKAGAFVAAK
ncbi:MAG: amidohydrolase family protein [Candidatus Eremiobacteraeota bacterium]|nr:amidohydrolase family protein [Candidatus Eremiobacteraeota bacterium]